MRYGGAGGDESIEKPESDGLMMKINEAVSKIDNLKELKASQ
jgi:hypothetical protein